VECLDEFTSTHWSSAAGDRDDAKVLMDVVVIAIEGALGHAQIGGETVELRQ
jgi:hypothetical protein